MNIYILNIFLSFLLNYIFLKSLLIPFLRIKIIDHPNIRSSHSIPTPRGGGLSFLFTIIISSCILIYKNIYDPMIIIGMVCIPLAIIGFIDDLKNLPRFFRYIVQILTSFILIQNSYLFTNSKSLLMFSLLFPILLISITAIINFTNFMDGIDGIVSGCMLVILSTSTLLTGNSLISSALIGSLLAFFILNWSPSKVFMGDVGSTFLGAIFAGFLLKSTTMVTVIKIIMVSSPLLFDAFTCVLRRLINGQPVFSPHKLHLYQRLVQAGWSHSKVSILYISATLLIGLSICFNIMILSILLTLSVLILGIFIDQKFAISFSQEILKSKK